MKHNKNNINQCTALIAKDLAIDKQNLDISDYENLKKQLTKNIQYLIDTDRQKLYNALYRIDISEKKLSELLTYSPPEKIAEVIAVLVIERESQKVVTRAKHRQSNKPPIR